MGMLVGGQVFSRGQDATRETRIRAARVLDMTSDLDDGFVLYLRPFDADRILAETEQVTTRGFSPLGLDSFLISGKTEEEQLADVLAPVGPLVTVASPHTTSPVAGATRTYLREGDWKPQVRNLIHRARFIVVCLGPSRNALWELAEVFASVPPERFAIIAPLNRAEYEESCRLAAAALAEAAPTVTLSSSEVRFPAYAGGDGTFGARDSVIRGILYYERDAPPSYVLLSSMKKTGIFAANKAYSFLEDAFRPLLRRLVEYEECQRMGYEPEWKIEHQENWYLTWSREILMFVLIGVLPGCAGVLLSGLAFGWRDDYSVAALVVPSIPAILMGVVVRRQIFPPSVQDM